MECLIKKIRDDVMAKGNGLNSLFLQRKKLVLLYIYSEFNKNQMSIKLIFSIVQTCINPEVMDTTYHCSKKKNFE